MEDWRREYEDCGDELEAIAKEAATRLEAAFDDELLERMVKAKGLTPQSD